MTGDPVVEMILNPVILEITLRNVWSMEKNPVNRDESLSNKYDSTVKKLLDNLIYFRNFRYASYRNSYFFLYKRNSKGKDARFVLPSCLVNKIRSKFPKGEDAEYVGFLQK